MGFFSSIIPVREKGLVIEPGRIEKNYWSDLWRYRELFFVFAWRDVSARYKQTIISVTWAILRPFMTMIVFTVIFGRLASLRLGLWITTLNVKYRDFRYVISSVTQFGLSISSVGFSSNIVHELLLFGWQVSPVLVPMPHLHFLWQKQGEVKDE